jgi:transcriptional regulator with XRE-family HTH domain
MPASKKIDIDFGRRIVELRRGRQQTLLAATAGINQGMWSKAEKGIIPQGDTLVKIARALDTTAEYLVFGGSTVTTLQQKNGTDGLVCYETQYDGRYMTSLHHDLLEAFDSLCSKQQQALLEVAKAMSMGVRVKSPGSEPPGSNSPKKKLS